MTNLPERFARLCRGYTQLADRFHKLDVEHMTLRQKLVPLLMAFKSCKEMNESLHQEKMLLEAELGSLRSQYERLKPLEILLEPDFQQALAEAEEQIDLVNQTFLEQDVETDPDLSSAEKALVEAYAHSTTSDFQSLVLKSTPQVAGLLS
jgi:predicted nuclease with TOPRIM domain